MKKRIYVKVIYFLLLCIFVSNIEKLNAETLQDIRVKWEKKQNNNHGFLVSGLKTDDGNYMAVGTFDRTNSTGSNLVNQGYVVKFDTNGNEIWSKKYANGGNNVLYSINKSPDGNYIVGGRTNEKTTNANHLGYEDFWLMKIDPNGNEIWSKQYGTSVEDDFRSAVTLSDGSTIMVGQTKGIVASNPTATASQNPLIIKVDSNGNQMWINTFGGQYPRGFTNVSKTMDGNIIVCGYTTVFSTVGKVQNTDAMIYKLDPDGNIIFYHAANKADDDIFYSVKSTSDGGYIAVGTTESDLHGNNPINGVDGFIEKIDDNGFLVWRKQFGNYNTDMYYSIEETSDKGFIIGGERIDKVTGDKYGLILKVDDNGNEEYERKVVKNNNVSIYNVIVDESSYLFVGSEDDHPHIARTVKLNKIKFSANGASGKMDEMRMEKGERLSLIDNKYYKVNHSFKGWSLSQSDANKGIIAFKNRDNFTQNIMKDVVLYASWQSNNSKANNNQSANNNIISSGSNNIVSGKYKANNKLGKTGSDLLLYSGILIGVSLFGIIIVCRRK